MANEVAVMYLGRIVTRAPVERSFANPQHPYTAGVRRGNGGRRGSGDEPSPQSTPVFCTLLRQPFLSSGVPDDLPGTFSRTLKPVG